jgi:hypothetical protein
MELAEGASNDINMLENSFVALRIPGAVSFHPADPSA